MRTIGLAAAVWSIVSIAQAAPLAAPLQPANDGKLECNSPNPAHRTCRSLATYKPRPDGRIDKTVVGLITPIPIVVVMTTVSQVMIKNGQVCGPLRREDYQAASFTFGGKPAPADQGRMLSDQMVQAMGPMIGTEVCIAYETSGGTTTARASFGGVRRPQADQTVIWVSPADGYKVAP
jgi:hypothetical protein